MAKQNDADPAPRQLNRRSALRGIGSVGVLATMAAGAAGLFSADPAMATTRNTRAISAKLRAARPVTVVNIGNKSSTDCCTNCTRSEGDCGVAHCPDSGCCYFCDGCGLNGFYCIDVSCSAGQTIQVCN